jgi:hypothetical protein
MKKTLKTILPISILLLWVTIPAVAFALDINTTSYVPLTDIPGLKDATATNPGGALKTIFNLSIGIGAILAVIMLIFGGFKYMYEESVFGKSDARQKIINAFFGLLLILGSYIILRTINSDLLRINLFLPAGDGKLAGLVATKQAADALDAARRAAAKTLATGLQKADALQNEADTLKKENADIAVALEKLFAGGKASDDLAISKLIAQQDENQQKIEQLEKDSQTVRSEAQRQGAETALALLKQKSILDITTANLSGLEMNKTSYENIKNTSLKAIDSNPSLTPEQRAAEKQRILTTIESAKYLNDVKIYAVDLLKSDSGATDDSTKEKLSQARQNVARDYNATIVSNPNMSEADKESLRKDYAGTQAMLKIAEAAYENKNIESRKTTIKCAVSGLVGMTVTPFTTVGGSLLSGNTNILSCPN